MSKPDDIEQWAGPVAWVVQLKYGPDQWSGEMLTDHLPADDETYRIVRPLYDARALLSAYERGRGEQAEDIAFIARWAWRTDPPGLSRALTDTERLSAIKYYPPVQKAATEHIELAEREAAEAHT